jgi:hypothetical protein
VSKDCVGILLENFDGTLHCVSISGFAFNCQTLQSHLLVSLVLFYLVSPIIMKSFMDYDEEGKLLSTLLYHCLQTKR